MPGEFDVLDHVEAPIFVLEPDADGCPRYVAFNRFAREAAGFEAADVMGKSALELYPGRYGELAFNFHRDGLSAATALDYELTLPLGGRNRTIRTHLEPVMGDSGEVVRLFGTSQDVSVTQGVKEMAAEAQGLHREIEDFIGLAAHDLRSPMRKVKMLAELLRRRSKSSDPIIDRLEAVATKSLTMISDIVSHVQATQAEETVEAFELERLGNEVLLMLDPEGKHDVTIRDARLVGDRVATQIVLRNLIDNALKHNAPKTLTLSVQAEQLCDESYLIAVKDDGAGFSEAALKYLQDQKLTSESGFGLAGARRLVVSRGGQIVAENRTDGAGAVVRFSLPGTIQEPAADEPSSQTQSA